MNERIKKLALQAGLENTLGCFWQSGDHDLERFVDLVCLDDRVARGAVLKKQDEQIKEMQITNARLFEKLNKAVLDEREACAKIALKYEPTERQPYVTYAADEIRARGNK